jgi:hypothetical protein
MSINRPVYKLDAKELRTMNDFLSSIPKKVIEKRKKLTFLEEMGITNDYSFLVPTEHKNKKTRVPNISENVFENTDNDRPVSANEPLDDSRNSIEIEVREIEYLKELQKNNPQLFKHMVKQKLSPKKFRSWYSKSTERQKIVEKRKELLHEKYKPIETYSFTPEINEHSKILVTNSSNNSLNKSKKVANSKSPKTKNIFLDNDMLNEQQNKRWMVKSPARSSRGESEEAQLNSSKIADKYIGTKEILNSEKFKNKIQGQYQGQKKISEQDNRKANLTFGNIPDFKISNEETLERNISFGVDNKNTKSKSPSTLLKSPDKIVDRQSTGKKGNSRVYG